MQSLLAVVLAAAAADPSYARPRPDLSLVVVVTVDQLRPDYFARYGKQFTGGFRTILDSGTLYDNGRQDHAITETAPGHSTILSGREPTSTGIVDNEHGVGDVSAPLLGGDPGLGASPRRFRGSALYDWVKASDPGVLVLSVSRKDRGAILPLGRARAPVYWWSNGRFTTSHYYADSLPDWVRRFNETRPDRRLAGMKWDLLLPPSAYTEPDSEPYENGGKDTAFPHRIPRWVNVAEHLQDYPWMDSLTLAFALDGARALDLGRRSRPDLLLVALSATDAVGHRYGPDSREMHDHLLRLDRWLGRFLDSLGTRVPRERMLVILTSDHGIQPFPERTHGKGRVWLGDMAREGRTFGSGLLSADTLALHARGIRIADLARVLADSASRRKGVARVYTPETLAAAPPADSAAMLWRNTLPAGYGWLIAAVLEPGFVWSTADAGAAEHGSTAELDVMVPIAFVGPGIARAVIHRPVRTVDIAPTLAELLGVRPAERLDGAALKEIVGGR